MGLTDKKLGVFRKQFSELSIDELNDAHVLLTNMLNVRNSEAMAARAGFQKDPPPYKPGSGADRDEDAGK